MRKFGRSGSFKSFTLIELLVVIAIISILAGFLLGAIGKAKQSAKYTRWKMYMDQLRKGGTAVALYDFEPGEKKDQLYDIGIGEAGDQLMKRNNDAVIVGAEWVEGRWWGSSALSFDGTGDYVYYTPQYNRSERRSTKAFEPGTSTYYTVLCWFKMPPGGVSAEQHLVAHGGKTTNTLGWAIRVLSSGKICINASETSEWSVAAKSERTTSDPINDTDWHCVGLLIDRPAQQVVGYLDGSRQGWDSYVGSLKAWPNRYMVISCADWVATLPLRIGAASEAPANPVGLFFKGTIGGVFIFKEKFSDAEIESHWKTGKP